MSPSREKTVICALCIQMVLCMIKHWIECRADRIARLPQGKRWLFAPPTYNLMFIHVWVRKSQSFYLHQYHKHHYIYLINVCTTVISDTLPRARARAWAPWIRTGDG